MITLEQIEKDMQIPKLKVAQIADSGEGKTYNAATFPKNVFFLTGPGEETTWKYRKELRKNIVGMVDLRPQDTTNLREIYKPGGTFDAAIVNVRKLVAEGKVASVTIDNLTYMTRDYWMYIREFRKLECENKNGDFDTRSAYGLLAQWLYETVKYKIVSLPCNVIVNVHLKVEDDEAIAKKADKTLSEVAAILGGFRNEFNGMFDLVMYLTKIEKGGVYKYVARVNKGNGKGAKSRLPIRDTLVEDISYDKLVLAINNSMKGE